MVAPVFISGRTNHRALKTIPLFSKLSLVSCYCNNDHRPFVHRSVGIFSPKRDDPTLLLSTFKATGLGGIISLLYGILLHGGSPDRDSMATPPELPEHTLSMVTAGIKMLTSIAVLNLEMFQVGNLGKVHSLCLNTP